MDIHKELREKLEFYSQDNIYGEEYYDDKIFDYLENKSFSNRKGIDFESRFRDVISDPNNLFINRVEDAGKIERNIITLHNGIKVYNKSYYDDFTKILILNKGVHEPSEERSFSKVLKLIDNNSTMIELGSYWSFYSMWFLKEKPFGRSFCIECDAECLKSGISNFELNNLVGNFTQNFIGRNGLDLKDFVKINNIDYIDILHSDIQGHELEMLEQIYELLILKKIKYLFISTHSNSIHQACIDFLLKNNYRIITSCDFEYETFQYDGFILACPNDLFEIENFRIGNRSISTLISNDYYLKLKKNLL
jgi:hypothetical protein